MSKTRAEQVKERVQKMSQVLAFFFVPSLMYDCLVVYNEIILRTSPPLMNKYFIQYNSYAILLHELR